MGDGLCYDKDGGEDCGSYKLTLGNGIVVASGGGTFNGEKEVAKFCIDPSDDGDDDQPPRTDDDYDDDDDDDDDHDTNDRKLLQETCPDVGCSWDRKKMKPNDKYDSMCMDSCDDRDEVFILKNKKKGQKFTCPKFESFDKFNEKKKLRKLVKKCKQEVLIDSGCGREMTLHAYDYCRGACKAVGPQVCMDNR